MIRKLIFGLIVLSAIAMMAAAPTLINLATQVTGILPAANLPGTLAIANTQFTTAISSVAANTCNSTVQVAITGVTTASTFTVTPSADTSAATGWGSTGGLILDTWPSTGYLNYKICNQTASAISSPGAVTFNVGVR